ncbi:MAG: hypothetical protein LBR52_01610 [Prevotellaceae bacterium]|jgi:hypothetical protein|nr:hypothetical protein [Prevotellaceae bacterium]
MKRIITLLVFTLIGLSVFAQSSKFRASGYYQKAIELYGNRNYSESLSYASKSRETLEGSNEQLQYLFIQIYVNQKDWVNAGKELQRFYDLREDREKDVYFSGTTTELTKNEEADLTKMMIDIEEKAAYVQTPEYKLAKKKEDAAQEIRDWFSKYVNPQKENSERVTYTNTSYTRTMKAYVTINTKEIYDFYVNRESYLGILDLGFRDRPGTKSGNSTLTISAYTSIKNISHIEYIGIFKFGDDYRFDAIRIHFNKMVTFNTQKKSSWYGNESESDSNNYITLPVTYGNSSVVERVNNLIKKYQDIK